MRKVYRYRDLSFAIADEDIAEFSVEFVSSGNIGQTIVNVPGPNDPEINNSGSAIIGKGKNLREGQTVVVSDLSNTAPQVDTIRLRYLINGEVIQEHTKPKAEEKNPIVILFIKFPEL